MRDVKDFLENLGQELDIQEVQKSEEKYIQHLRVVAQSELNIEINQEHKAKISLGKLCLECVSLNLNANCR